MVVCRFMASSWKGFCPDFHPAWPPERRCLCCTKLSLCFVSLAAEWPFVSRTDKASANSHFAQTTRAHTNTDASPEVSLTMLRPRRITNLQIGIHCVRVDVWISLSLIQTEACRHAGTPTDSHLKPRFASESIKKGPPIYGWCCSVRWRSSRSVSEGDKFYGPLQKACGTD